MGQEAIVAYVRAGDPGSGALLQQLQQRQLEFTVRDIDRDPGAAAELTALLGRQIVVPVVRIGERLLVGYDPVQLARFLPRAPGDAVEGVSFGAAVRGVTDEVARASGLPARYGVEVGRVVDGAPAQVAGIQAGDIITEIGGYTLLGGAEQFRIAVAARHPGDTMAITVWRAGSSLPVTIAFPREEGHATTEAITDAETGKEAVRPSRPTPDGAELAAD